MPIGNVSRHGQTTGRKIELTCHIHILKGPITVRFSGGILIQRFNMGGKFLRRKAARCSSQKTGFRTYAFFFSNPFFVKTILQTLLGRRPGDKRSTKNIPVVLTVHEIISPTLEFCCMRAAETFKRGLLAVPVDRPACNGCRALYEQRRNLTNEKEKRCRRRAAPALLGELADLYVLSEPRSNASGSVVSMPRCRLCFPVPFMGHK